MPDLPPNVVSAALAKKAADKAASAAREAEETRKALEAVKVGPQGPPGRDGTDGKDGRDGIDFSADGNAAGMTSELLDDYEEGTWTPTIEGVTTPGTYEINTAANLRNATYIKVGRMVTLSARFQLAAVVTGGGSGAVVIGGIPFSVAADRTCLGSIALGTVSFSGSLSVSPRSITAASTQLNIFKSTDATGITLVAVSDIDAGDVFQFTITYAAT